ncbi:MAG: hypothetical protein VKQ33_12915 [Candidatus Sericytochromatia bacterium]|nr:hypothetical protein [Candidatus Sericytochromatia bacterium]
MMQARFLLRPVLTFGLVAALVVSSQPLGVQAAEPVGVAVGAAAWEAASERLVVPVRGGSPRIHLQQLAARQFVADLAGCSLTGPAPRGGVVGHSRLSGWSMAAEPSLRGVRVRLTVADDVRPVARFDAALGGVVFTFTGAGSAAPALATAPRLALQAPEKPGAVGPRFPTRVHVGEAFPVRPSVAGRPGGTAERTHLAGHAVRLPSGPARPAPAAVAKAAPHAPHAGRPQGVVAARVAPAGAKRSAPSGAAGAPRTAARPTIHPAFAASAGSVRGPLRTTARRPAALPLVLLAAADPAPRVRRVPATIARVAQKRAKVAAVAVPSKAGGRSTARREAVGRLGLPVYRAGAEVLAIPVQSGRVGPASVSTVRLNKRWSYIDIAGVVPTFSGVRYHERHDHNFQRWVMARRPGRDVTRVSFAVGVPSRLDVKVTDAAVLVAVRPVGVTLARATAPGRRGVTVASRARKATPVAAVPPASAAATVARSRAPRRGQAAAGKAARGAAPATVAAHAPKLALQAGQARGASSVRAAESRVRRPFYDAERYGLAIPYEGRAPLYRWARRTEQGAVIELKADVLNASHLQADARRTGAWGSWKLSRRPNRGPLALELAFTRPSEVSIAADPERKQLLVIPQPRIAKVAVAEASPVRSALARLVVDQAGGNLFIPFRGEVPRYVIEQVTPTFAYVVFEAAALRDGGVQFFTPDAHPALNYLLVTQPEGTSTVRLAVSLSQPAAAAVYQDPGNTRLVVTLAQNTPVVQATGPKALRVPAPWPGAARPAPHVQGNRGDTPRS